MKNNEIESLLLAEMEEVTGGSMGTCVCENGGAGETVVIIRDDSSNDGSISA